MNKQKGITSVLQWQFIAAFCLYFLSILFFAEIGKQGFKWSQLTFSAFIAFVIITSLCWQWRLLGDPRRVANFILHMAFLISCVFFVNRLFVKESILISDIFGAESGSVFDGFVNTLELLSRKIVSWIPAVIFDALRSPGVAILFLMVTLSLSLKRRTAIALLILSLFISSVFCIHNSPSRESWLWFFAGVISLGTAIYLQADDPDKRRFRTTIISRLKDDPALRADLELKMRLLKRIYEQQRPLRQVECLGIVSRALGMETESPQAREITRRIADNLVHQDHLAKYAEDRGEKTLGMNPEEFRQGEPDGFAMIAIMPKTIIFVIFAFIWIISPVDLILDATPIFGVLDDVIVGTLGFNTVLQTATGIQLVKGQGSQNLFGDNPG